MSLKIKLSITYILFALFLGTGSTSAQVLRDSTTLKLIKTDVDCIYNHQFADAQAIYSKIQKSYPAHPVLYLLRGLQTYWKNYPMTATTPARASFEKDMRQCMQLAKKNKNPQYEAEYLLYNLSAKGMLLKFYEDNGLSMDVIPLASSTYDNLSRSFDLARNCSDLFYFTGAYNYYREAYPNAYPVYKPLVFLFRHGDMKAGLKELQNASVNAIVLRPEASFLLTWIYLNFENNYPQALKFSKSLHETYPENMLYTATYIKNLLLVKQYNEAEKHVDACLKVTGNKYFQTQLYIFKGILLEKKYHDYNAAAQYYKKGIGSISSLGDYGNEYAAYAYFGLSRISYNKKEMDAGKQFRESAMKVVVFKNITFDK
jgi:hypothetical protein